MVSVKSLERFFERDPANDSPGLTLESLYEDVPDCSLHAGVPQEIRDYFHVVVTLFLYGWLYYPFYALASERSFFALEMALRKRLPQKSERRRGLAKLLKEAKRAELLRDADFLIQTLPRARNRFAHPNMQMIMSPGPMFDGLVLAAEIINQLWPVPQTK